ncbi:hypothetical protein CLV59_108244 [Chitinophaga dinghuensis]|uniref:PH (Pleckstrin Homology) domain-containing protein n=1 Tax=Chitinophaga dinghuensis TaxID=1539050 RepID=A0A327VNQ0_9BACT|nr:hypothetical protein [Chitinophaga dinghuensis]RAJ76723.1 hypothetical protein CLV59_108244 [Chitinophaga dinghuensis]
MPFSRLERTIHGLQQLASRKKGVNFLEVRPDNVIIKPPCDSRSFVLASWLVLCLIPLSYLIYTAKYGVDSWAAPILLLLICLFICRDLLLLTEGQQYVTINFAARQFEFHRVHTFAGGRPRYSTIDFNKVQEVILTSNAITGNISVQRIVLLGETGEKLAFFDLRKDQFSSYTAGKLRLLFSVIIYTYH